MPDLTEAERRKLAGTSPHALRHTAGTQMLAAGVALEVVQRTLGLPRWGQRRSTCHQTRRNEAAQSSC
nr:tyrosine-type recombinase/integrase [Burkholderia stagnalis]